MANLFSDSIFLPLQLQECVYILGILKRSERKCSEGDERNVCVSVMRRLEMMMSDSSSYEGRPFSGVSK